MYVIKAKRGDSIPFSARFMLNGVEEDLSATTIRMQVRNKNDEFVVELNSSRGISVKDNIININIPPDYSSLIAPGKYTADIEVTFPSGRVRSSDTFSIIIERDITY